VPGPPDPRPPGMRQRRRRRARGTRPPSGEAHADVVLATSGQGGFDRAVTTQTKREKISSRDDPQL
jgi:hypothetical protein